MRSIKAARPPKDEHDVEWRVNGANPEHSMKSIVPRIAAAAFALCGLFAAPLAMASAQLAAQAGCAACHLPDRKLVGPAYKEIAAKYKARADAVPYLMSRVRKGGPGNWGQIPMVPTDAKKLPDANLKKLLDWILKTPQ
jgi:cytochrome c